jgi:hypothetical protein
LSTTRAQIALGADAGFGGDPRIHVLDNPTNLGFGGSYKRGASVATATYVVMLPCDNGFPGQSIAEILGHAGEADIIIPIVTNRGTRHWFRAFASKGFTTLLNWAFWLNVGYYNGAVLQRNELLRTIEITTNSFAYQAEAPVKLIARGATYKHCYVSIQERAAGRSSALSLKNQIAVWRTILHLLAAVGLFCRLPLVTHAIGTLSDPRAPLDTFSARCISALRG